MAVMDSETRIRVKIKVGCRIQTTFIDFQYKPLDGTLCYYQISWNPSHLSYENLTKTIRGEFGINEDFSISYLARDKYGEQSHCLIQSNFDLESALSQCSDLTLRLLIDGRAKSDEGWDIVSNDEVSLSPHEDASLTLDPNSNNQDLFNLSSHNSMLPNSINKCSSSGPGSYLSSGIRYAQAGSTFLHNVSQQFMKTVMNLKNDLTFRPPLSGAELRGYMDDRGRIVHSLEFYQNVYLRGIEPCLRKFAWRILLNVYPPEFDGEERMTLLHSRIERYERMKLAWKRAYQEGRLNKAQINAIALACIDVVRTDRGHPFYCNDGINHRLPQLFSILATYAIHHPGIGYHQGMSNIASLLLYVQDNEGAAYVCLCALMQRLAPKFSPHHDQVIMITQMQHLHDLLVYTDYTMAQFLRMHNLGNMFFTERWLLLELIREFSFDQALHVSEVQWAAIALASASWPDVGSTKLYSHLSAEQPPVSFDNEGMKYAQCDTNLINGLIGDEFKYDHAAVATEDTVVPLISTNNQKTRRNSSTHEGDPVHMKDWVVELPTPDAIGGGNNPFLLFICVSMIVEYREAIFAQVNEICDLFHLFQIQNKRHNLYSILNRARSLFDTYLKDQEKKRHNLINPPQLERCLFTL